MKIYWRRPTEKQLEHLLMEQQNADYSHENVASTRPWSGDLFDAKPNSVVKDGYLIQRRRANIGTGESAFLSGSAALRKGTCFDLPWVHYHAKFDLSEGAHFCLVAHAFGLHAASVCRVVYSDVQDSFRERIYSIGVGTLPAHAAIGEEKLAVHWNKQTEEVDFLIGSYSKPATWISRMLVGYLRNQQDRFARDSVERMMRAVKSKPAAEQFSPQG